MTSLDRCQVSHNLLLRVALAELARVQAENAKLLERQAEMMDERNRWARQLFGRTPADD